MLLFLEVPGFHSFLQNTREKRRIATTSNGTETQRYIQHQQQQKEKRKRPPVRVAFILIGKTQIEKYNPQKMDKNNSNLSFQK